MHIRPFTPADTDAVVALWELCGLTRLWNDPRKDIARKLTVQPELFLVAQDESDRVIGTVMGGFEGHRGWINYLAVDPGLRHRGLGSALVAEVEQGLRDLGCPKINVQIRRDNAAAIEFYEGLGFGQDQVISLGKRLVPDES